MAKELIRLVVALGEELARDPCARDALRVEFCEEYNNKLAELKSELFNLRFRLASGQLENPVSIRTCKRDIARVNTEIRARELKA